MPAIGQPSPIQFQQPPVGPGQGPVGQPGPQGSTELPPEFLAALLSQQPPQAEGFATQPQPQPKPPLAFGGNPFGLDIPGLPSSDKPAAPASPAAPGAAPSGQPPQA